MPPFSKNSISIAKMATTAIFLPVQHNSMKILVTGTPGTGKTTVSKALARHFGLKLISEKEFAKKNRAGIWNSKEKVLEIDPLVLEKKLSKELSRTKNAVLEGHLLCETKLKVDFAVLLHTNLAVLEKRLKKRSYITTKVLDNVFSEETGYCKKQLLKRYPKAKIIEADSSKNLKETANKLIIEINKQVQRQVKK